MTERAIRFFTEGIQYQIRGKKDLRRGIEQLIKNRKNQLGTINIILCSDPFLKRYNKRYLNHDFYTDVIAFSLSEECHTITGDIFISLDRVRENSRTYKTGLRKEIVRVIIHGILHLMGMEDSTRVLKKGMREEEDKFLSGFFRD